MEKSASIVNIAKALQLFRVKVDKIVKSSENTYFKNKYAGLPEILEAIQTPLDESGLTFTQFPDGDMLTTILIHSESGEYMQASYAMHPVKSDPQSIGSAITYARRYAIGAILSLNVVEDDDGNKASGKTDQKQPETKTETKSADLLPWLTEQQFTKAMERITAGEIGIIEKMKPLYRIKREYREKLEEAEKGLVSK